MALQTNTERAAIRLAPYLGELQEFFSTRSIKFGAPEDLAPIAEQLSVPGSFPDEMASMIRSILYRENGAVPHVEFVELITVAIGGPHVDEAAQGLHEPVRRILAFISGVLRSRRSPSSGGLALDSRAPDSGATDSGATETAVDHPVSLPPAHQESYESAYAHERALADVMPERRHVSDEPGPTSVDRIGPGTASRTSTHIYFRASTIPALPLNREELASGEEDAVAPAPNTEVLETRTTPYLVPPQAKTQPAKHTFSWVFGLGLIPLVLFANMYLNHRAAVRTSRSSGQTALVATDVSATTDGTRAVVSAAPLAGAQDRRPAPVAPGTPARQPYPGFSSGIHQLSGASQQDTLPTPGQVSSNVSPAIATSSVDPRTSESEGASYSGRISSAPTLPGSFGVPTGHPVRISQYTRQGSFAVSSGVMAGNLVSAPAPEYPKMASFARIQGQVVLQAVVSRNGSVIDTRVIRGPHLLRGAATQAVRRFRYRPYVLNGRPTDVATIVTVDFHLHR